MSDGPIVIYWGHRHFHLFASICDSIEEAAREAWHDSGSGEAAFECVEVIEGGISRIADISEFWQRWNAEEDAEIAKQAERPIVSTTDLRAPEIRGAEGVPQWAAIDWYRDAADARRHAEHVARFGERVRFTIK